VDVRRLGATSLGTRVLGIYLIGIGLNYAPPAAYAVALSRPGALDAELAGVDTGRELRRYGVLQLWIFVPLSLVAMAATARGPRPRTRPVRRAGSRDPRRETPLDLKSSVS
jgi:hypothetical protein